MKPEYYHPETLTKVQIRLGIEFILRRFKEEWSVDRTADINESKLKKRANVLLYDSGNLVGWLGIEKDGEIVNCCIEKGYNGVDCLQNLIKEAYKSFPKKSFYAHVPTERLSSAIAFIKTGMKLDETPQSKILKYNGESINLVRLRFEKTRKVFKIEDEYLSEILDKINEVENGKISSLSTRCKNYFKSNYKSIILCLFISFALYITLIRNVAKISWQDYYGFIVNNESYTEDRKMFEKYLESVSTNIDKYEKLSSQHQFNLKEELLNDFSGKSEDVRFLEISKIINKNKIIISTISNLRKYQKDLIGNKGIYKRGELEGMNRSCISITELKKNLKQ